MMKFVEITMFITQKKSPAEASMPLIAQEIFYFVHKQLYTCTQYDSLHENIDDVLRDLVPFVQLKKHEKHSWWSVTFNKVAGF